MFKFACNRYEYSPTEKALLKVREWLNGKLEEKNENFSNGRLVRNFFDDVVLAQSKRLAAKSGGLSKTQLVQIIESDIPVCTSKIIE
ncbi:hypothetical protein [Streptococcus anginosus]|uniref:hypothetical protein n=1 Tax=Streptococcus anginosus TaxID=1328 RepID=UPI0034A15238